MKRLRKKEYLLILSAIIVFNIAIISSYAIDCLDLRDYGYHRYAEREYITRDEVHDEGLIAINKKAYRHYIYGIRECICGKQTPEIILRVYVEERKLF